MINFFENFLFSGNPNHTGKFYTYMFLNANEIHLWTFSHIQLHEHERSAPIVTRACNAARVEYDDFSMLHKRDMCVSVDGNVRARLTRCLREQLRIKPHIEQMSMCKEDAVPRNLYGHLIVDTIRIEITVTKHTYNPFAGQLLQHIRIRREVSRMEPKFRLSCTGHGKHIVK